MAVHVPGLIAIIVFYVLILAIGIWAARKSGLKTKNLKVSEIMLADRSIGLLVGIFTTTATWVGGGYINGSTEIVTFSGLVWCQAPIGYTIGLMFCGFFFAEKMRTSGFTTMLDPLRWKYGDIMSCLLYLPALCGDVFWSASILASLGATLKVILDISLEVAIIVSAAIAVVYTLLGGLYSVAYTDVVQLICMFIGLWICVPFAMTNDAVSSITDTKNEDRWLGTLVPGEIGLFIDYYLLLMLGGIPWQVYWQRALSARTIPVAKALSLFAGVGCIIMALPAILLGAVAVSADWNQTSYGHPRIMEADQTLTLPLVMRYLTPTAVGFVGLGAVSAAVMSSTDSSILSSSCMFSRNVFAVIYSRIWKKTPSETAQVWTMRVAQVVIASMACAMAITVDSIYSLFVLCGDFVYVLLFPQLLCVMYIKGTNAYGSITAFTLGLFFRLAGGESSLNIPAVIKYPWYAEETQYFPFRTMSMLIALFSLIFVSWLMKYVFEFRVLPLCMDVYGCFPHLKEEEDKTRRRYRATVADDPYSSLRYRGMVGEKIPDSGTERGQASTRF